VYNVEENSGENMKQKTILIVLLMFLMFAMSGCFFKEPILVNENILLYTDKEVINESNSFTIQEDSIPLYRNEQDDTISYVDIEEFVAFLGGGLLNYNVFKEDTLLLDFRQVIPVDLVEVVGEEVVIYEVEFDHEENTIYASDLDIFTRLNLVHSISTNDFVNLSEIISNNENPEIVIDLDDYGFDVLYENDHYYLPFYLANLFLTGASFNFYETDDAIVLFDYGTETEQVRKHYTSSSLTLEDVREATNNYLALYFDYFYGLKEDKEIDSFITYLEEYELNNQNTFIDHYEAISDFVFSLDDLHSRIMDTGFLLPEYEPAENFLLGSKVNTYSIAYQANGCSVYPEDFNYEEIEDGTHLFKIPGFTFETGEQFSEYVSLIDANDDVIIDLTCNTGGSLKGVVKLLIYLSNAPAPVRHINSKTNQLVEEFYTNDELALDVNLYIVTSGVTYSAAHVFASVVRDMKIGTVIGNPTLGGSSALVFTVLPNGLILSNSSYMTFVDESFTIDDDGTDVDLVYGLPYDILHIASDIDSYYSIGTKYFAEAVDVMFLSRIQLNIMEQDDAIVASEYIVTVYDTIGNTVFSETFTDEFSFRYDFDGSIDLYDVEIVAVYVYDSITYQDIIFYQPASN